MSTFTINTNPLLEEKFAAYPPEIMPKIQRLRDLVLEVAAEKENIDHIEETLKWGEPSFLAKKGSTIRMDWKEKKPDQYAMYFKCTSKLVPTFKEVFGDTFNYETTRAIVFALDEDIPEMELKVCIGLALEYHRLKGLPRMGL